MKIPFSVYDFFAYLASGFMVLAALDFGVGTGHLLSSDVTVTSSALLLVSAYVLGQLVAQVSALTLEAGLVGRILGRPSQNLFNANRSGFRFLFPGYFRAFPAETCARIKAAADARSFRGEGEALFLHAYGIVTTVHAAQERLDSFRNLYGFARNMTVALGLGVVIVAYGSITLGRSVPTWIPIIGGVASIGMLYRYLKFFRQYSYQLFVVYAEGQEGGS